MTQSRPSAFGNGGTAITQRKDAVYPATIVGIPPVKLFLPIFKMNFPEIVHIALSARRRLPQARLREHQEEPPDTIMMQFASAVFAALYVEFEIGTENRDV